MIYHYFKSLLFSLKRHKGFMVLNLITLSTSMLVIMILVGVLNLMFEPDILDDTKGTIYRIQLNRGRFIDDNLSKKEFEPIKDAYKNGDLLLISTFRSFSMVSANRNKQLNYRYINEKFSDNFKLSIVEGHMFQKKHFEKKQKVVVVSESLAETLFGDKSAIDKDFIIHRNRHKIIGVFKNQINGFTYSADFYLPLYIHPYPQQAGLTVFVQDKSETAMQALKARLKKHDIPRAKYEVLALKELKAKSLGNLWISSLVFIGLSLLLPTLLVSNITIHRMELRLEELGIRKAFGAGRRAIYLQLLVENMLFTLFAGSFAFVLGQYLISGLYYDNINHFLQFAIPFNVGIAVFVVYVLFAIVTGLLPARKVARQSIVKSLKSI